MHNTKLIELLRTLNLKEFSRFRAYVHAPFFNKNKKLKALIDHILRFSPDFMHPQLNKKAIYPYIFGEQSYNEIQLNNLISDLLQLLYGFLSHLQYQQRPQYQKYLLLEELLNRDRPKHIERNAQRFKNIQAKSEIRNYEYFHHEYLLYEKLDQSVVRHAKRSFDKNLQLQSDNLDLYFFSNKLRIACDMASRNIVIQAGYSCDFLDDILNYYENNYRSFQSFPALSIYYKVLKMLETEDNEQAYLDLKADLQQHQHLFPKLELWTLYKYAINFCIKKINSGKGYYYEELLELYKVLLENEIIFPNGYLSQWTFKNIITVGIRLEAFEWTELFISQYEKFLLPEEHFNASTYNRAALFSARKDYQQALQTLHNVEFTDSSYHLGAKIIQLKSYFELEETEALYALIEAFRKYILRNRDISEYRKKANNNMLKIAKGIYQLKVNGSAMTTSAYNQKRKNLQQKLNELNPIANKDWLNEIFLKASVKNTAS